MPAAVVVPTAALCLPLMRLPGSGIAALSLSGRGLNGPLRVLRRPVFSLPGVCLLLRRLPIRRQVLSEPRRVRRRILRRWRSLSARLSRPRTLLAAAVLLTHDDISFRSGCIPLCPPFLIWKIIFAGHSLYSRIPAQGFAWMKYPNEAIIGIRHEGPHIFQPWTTYRVIHRIKVSVSVWLIAGLAAFGAAGTAEWG